MWEPKIDGAAKDPTFVERTAKLAEVKTEIAGLPNKDSTLKLTDVTDLEAQLQTLIDGLKNKGNFLTRLQEAKKSTGTLVDRKAVLDTLKVEVDAALNAEKPKTIQTEIDALIAEIAAAIGTASPAEKPALEIKLTAAKEQKDQEAQKKALEALKAELSGTPWGKIALVSGILLAILLALGLGYYFGVYKPKSQNEADDIEAGGEDEVEKASRGPPPRPTETKACEMWKQRRPF